MCEAGHVGLTMEMFFDRISRIEYPDIGTGHCHSFDEVYRQVVSRARIESAVLNRWWQLLKRYVQREDCIVFIRKYGNERPRSNQRRGFYSRCPNGFGYVYCDNKLAHYFYTMAWNGFVPDIDVFARAIRNRIMPYGPGGAREERELQAYTHGPTTRINSRGWYLPHIFSADNPHDYHPAYLQSRQLFDKGDRSQWCRHGDEEYSARNVRNFTDEERRIFVAHFLRLVNPMNYFLMPWQPWQRTVVDGRVIGKGLGEFGEFINYMRLKRHADPVLTEALNEFEDMIMCLPYQGVTDLDVLGRREVDYLFSHDNQQVQHHNRASNTSVRRNQTENAVFRSKAVRRIGGWSRKPDSKPFRIIRAYLVLRGQGEPVTLRRMEDLCSDAARHPDVYVAHFAGNWASMKCDGGNSYGRVFLQEGEVVLIDPEVAEALRPLEHRFLV